MSKSNLDKWETIKVEPMSFQATQRVERPLIQTSELPAIPEKLITEDVSEQAKLVIEAYDKSETNEFEEEQDKEREVYLRRRLVVELKKVLNFLNMILQKYRDGFPTLPEQMSIYTNTITATINSLDNNDINTRDIIISINRTILPLFNNLHYQFQIEEDENFSFESVNGEIKECLSILARMVKNKL
jgi:hypothetical protein